MRPSSPSRIPLLCLAALGACASNHATPDSVDARQQPQQQSHGAIAPPAPLAGPAPTLVVFITVDQLSSGYFEQLKGQLTGGLGRFSERGAFFTNAFQDHAFTETAPGHASTMSGRFPRSTGIVRNIAGVNDSTAPLIGGGGEGASPRRFRGTVLYDWIQAVQPNARALSVSRKDRGAILPLGRAKQEIYWYAPLTGEFTTSVYYRDTLPDWVRRFNGRQLPRGMAGRAWTLLRPESSYPEPDSVASESGGRGYTFPHVVPADSDLAVQALPEFPFMDEVTAAFAIEGVRALGLGAGPQTDVLAVSLSTTDAIGHRYGVMSREAHDQVLRVDRTIGMLIDSLYAMRDSTRIVFALTADHGVTTYLGPKFNAKWSARDSAGAAVWSLVRRVQERLNARGADWEAVDYEAGMFFANRAKLRQDRVDADSLLRAFVADARRIPGVLRADLMAQVTKQDTTRDAIARRWYHAIPPDLPVGAVVTLEPGVFPGPVTHAVFSHGTPHDPDAHVPVMFYGPPFRPGRYGVFARVVDMAPTLAAVVGVAPTETLDGHVLREAIRDGVDGTK
ncbi:MAG TPA: alkaline phosphatase family protein [Gemmatimonadaceae bacterium]|nr:alkaline phosphatase family protein [Gemmatimonadaceae bacterium]